jgi:hypothetical protein
MAPCQKSISVSITGLIQRRYHRGGTLASYNQLRNAYHSALPAINQKNTVLHRTFAIYYKPVWDKKNQFFVAEEIKQHTIYGSACQKRD